jgi:DNA-binding response OmpR family regulator
MTKRVLLVEDNPGLAKSYSKALSQGYSVELAKGSREALKSARREAPYIVAYTGSGDARNVCEIIANIYNGFPIGFVGRVNDREERWDTLKHAVCVLTPLTNEGLLNAVRAAERVHTRRSQPM